ncbi:hypothetical protein E2C01_082332 [Portunus trituberculatus]|uniref:Uncharacterized protein n=1 Tax=Portunus trituberculatus TaxID=210409 RepID=A0A5B7IS26_PORTR|nr:hypothetical protein [Portunus trituberculatus]
MRKTLPDESRNEAAASWQSVPKGAPRRAAPRPTCPRRCPPLNTITKPRVARGTKYSRAIITVDYVAY